MFELHAVASSNQNRMLKMLKMKLRNVQLRESTSLSSCDAEKEQTAVTHCTGSQGLAVDKCQTEVAQRKVQNIGEDKPAAGIC